MMDADTLLTLYANINRLQAENARLRREKHDHRRRIAHLEMLLGMRLGPEEYMRVTRTKFSQS